MSIIEDIKKGENKKIEFKSIFPSNDKIMKTAVAFSNCAGGKLIIGVEDDGNIIGISDEDIFDFPDRISNIIYDACYPTIIPEIYTETIEDKTVLVVELYPGNLKPYYIKSKQKLKGTYVRVGATNKLADENMILELERQKRNISFDEEINYESDIKEESLNELISDFYNLSNRKINNTDLINLKLLKNENGKIYMSNACSLLTKNNGEFDYAKIKCARFKGIDTMEFIDSKDFEGPLYKQVEESMKFIKIYIEKQSQINELQRKDKYSIPLVAIREALVNAVVHRDYTITGSSIMVAIFDDRIEIKSPGALPKSLDINDITLGRSEVRNKVIARFFKEIGYIEQWGTGIKRIISLCNENRLKVPSFLEIGNGFEVKIFKEINYTNSIIEESDDKIEKDDNSGDKVEKDDNSGDKVNIDDKIELCNDRERLILNYILENGFVTTKIAMSLIELKETATKNTLKKMVDKSLIQSQGNGKARRYILNM